MNPKVRLVLYVVLLGCMAACAAGFMDAYRSTDSASRSAAAGTNSTALTNLLVSTNAAGALQTNVQASPEPAEDMVQRRSSPRMGRLMGFGIAMFFVLVALAVMAGHDVSRFFANRVEEFVFKDNLDGAKDPDYEEAEQVLASGDALEAVRLMRAYLNRHPREQYVALNIAEIYEKQLHNYLAAALEYEEVLKKRLPAERWGWAAVHLSNLYSGKLNRPADAAALLRRIVDEYGQTSAAKKARERLGVPEPIPLPPLSPAPAVEPEPEPAPAPPASQPSNLPPGFRPKG